MKSKISCPETPLVSPCSETPTPLDTFRKVRGSNTYTLLRIGTSESVQTGPVGGSGFQFPVLSVIPGHQVRPSEEVRSPLRMIPVSP